MDAWLQIVCVCEQQVKLNSPDYTDCNTEEAVQDFMKRIKCYENMYEQLDEVLDRSEHLPFNIINFNYSNLHAVHMVSFILRNII